MQVHIIAPFSLEKNLAKAYNEAMSKIPDGDFACIHDIDVSFLTPDAGNILHEYALRNPEAHLLTCYTNRISTLSKWQLLTGKIDENLDYKYHVELAEKQKQFLYQTTQIKGTISGMLMLISKEKWKEIPFIENGQCLAVDTIYSRKLLQLNKKILRMDGLYVLHIYRVKNGVSDKSHLKVA